MSPEAHSPEAEALRPPSQPAADQPGRLNLLSVRLTTGHGALLSTRPDAAFSESELAALQSRNQSVFGWLSVKVAESLIGAPSDARERRLWQEDVQHYVPGFFKTAGLFLRGSAGWALTSATYALDEMKVNSSWGERVFDGVLGAGKGAATRGLLHLAHARQWSPARTGAVVGASGRFVDGMLTRQNYFDAQGNFRPGGAFNDSVKQALNPSIFADIAIFSVAAGGSAGVNHLTKGALNRSPFWRTTVTGAVFGSSSGFSSEFMRQHAEGDYDAGRLLKRTLIQGGIDGVAAMGGGWQASRAHARELSRLRQLESAAANDGTQSQLLTERALSAVPENLAELTAKLGKPDNRVEMREVLKNPEPTQTNNFAEWAEQNVRVIPQPVVVYRHGQTEIIVPKEYNGQLNRGRQALLDRGNPVPEALRETAARLLPEEVIPILESLPDRGKLVRAIYLHPEPPVTDHFRRQSDPGHRSSAEAMPGGSIHLYAARRGEGTVEDVRHEWTHLLKWHLPAGSRLFDLAAEMEANGYFAREYARQRNASGEPIENFAVHTAEEIMSSSPDRARFFGHKAPIRTAVILRMLSETVNESDISRRTDAQRDLSFRIESLSREILPKATTQLLEAARQTQDPVRAEQAAHLLLALQLPFEPGSLTGVTRFTAGADSFVTDAMVARAAQMPIRHMEISSIQLSAQTLAALSASQTLTELALRNTGLSSYTLARFRPPTGLESLDLSGNRNLVEMPSFLRSGRLRNLRVIDLSSTQIPARDIENLAASHPTVQIHR